MFVEGITSEAIIGKQNLNPLEIGQILSFKLDDFLLDAFGVTVEANGDFEFDNEDFQTFSNLPKHSQAFPNFPELLRPLPSFPHLETPSDAINYK